MAPSTIGEFEQLVLLAILQLGDEARAITIRERLQQKAGRSVSRGALYATLDRLERKGFLDWEVEDSTPERGGLPRRRFRVTETGLEKVRGSLAAITHLTEGLEGVLGLE